MSETLGQIQALVERGETRISLHGYDELADDQISVREVVRWAEGRDPARGLYRKIVWLFLIARAA